MSVSIVDARAMKLKCENNIRELLIKFATETGLCVEEVRLQMTVVETVGKVDVSCTAVTIEVDFGG